MVTEGIIAEKLGIEGFDADTAVNVTHQVHTWLAEHRHAKIHDIMFQYGNEASILIVYSLP